MRRTKPYLILRFLPMRKYRREPRKGRKMMIRTHIILSFPWNSLLSTLIRAIRGNSTMNTMINRIMKIPPPKIVMPYRI
jgi:hypothetical protein